jgi:molybdenum cofactor cytidylyltransferase
MSDITGILLAAGRSHRFGADKLCTEIRGRSLILASTDCLRTCDRLLVVVRADNQPLQEILHKAEISMVINPQADLGMASSIACGILASSSSDAWCILPGDMPFIDPRTGDRIVATLRQGASLVAPYYRGHRGHPVGFNRDYRDRLLALEGDTGAREILASESQTIVKISVEDAGILHDIDNPQDLITDNRIRH